VNAGDVNKCGGSVAKLIYHKAFFHYEGVCCENSDDLPLEKKQVQNLKNFLEMMAETDITG
jgi:hypothetical protein